MNRMNLLASSIAVASMGAVAFSHREVDVALESINLASNELNTGLDTLTEIQGDAIALEGYAELGASFQGGMNSQSAIVMAHGAGHLANRWGVSIESVGVESFDDNPAMATQVACEGFKEAAVALWDGFINMLKKIRAAAKDALAKYFNAGTKLKKAFESMEDKVGDLGEIKDGKDKVSGDFLKAMVIGGKFDASELKSMADRMDKEVNASASAIDAATKAVIDVSEKSPEEHASNAKTMFDQSLEYKSAFEDNKLAKSFEKLFGGEKGAAKYKVGMVLALPRDSYMVFAMNDAGTEQVKFITGVNLDAADKEIAALDVSGLESWITSGIKAAEQLEATKKDWAKVEKAQDALLSAVEKIASKAKSVKEDDKEAAKGWKKVHRGMTNYSSNLQSLDRGINDSIKNVATGIYGYVSASMSAYNKA